MTGPSVTVLASANLDLVGTAATLPRPGETVLGETFTMNPGGKGLNQAIAVARLGGACTAIAAVGDDPFGQVLLAGLATDGVDTRLVRVAPGPSGVALIAVDAAGENQILVAPGANATLGALTDDELGTVAAAQALVCQLELPIAAVTQAAAAARRAGVAVVLNAAPARDLPTELLRATDLLVVNRGEAETLCGASGAGVDELTRRLAATVDRVAITLGPDGVAYRDADQTLRVQSPVVPAVDATAAGDAFVGALTVAWLEGRPMRQALRWACAAGAACARTAGASASIPARATVDELYEQTYGAAAW
jgi:ribokinase